MFPSDAEKSPPPAPSAPIDQLTAIRQQKAQQYKLSQKAKAKASKTRGKQQKKKKKQKNKGQVQKQQDTKPLASDLSEDALLDQLIRENEAQRPRQRPSFLSKANDGQGGKHNGKAITILSSGERRLKSQLKKKSESRVSNAAKKAAEKKAERKKKESTTRRQNLFKK